MKRIGKKKGKKILLAILAVLLLAGCIGAVIWQRGKSDAAEPGKEFMDMTPGEENVLTGEGTTQMGITEVSPEFDVTNAKVTVEEVYVEAGATVTPGDAIYKVNEESLAEEITYYEEEIAKAEKTLRTAKNSYSAGVKEAEYTYQNSVNDADYAKSTYDAAVSELDAAVEEKENQLEETKADISMYQTNLDNNNYYSSNKIEEKQQTAEQTAGEEQAKQVADTAAKTACEEAQQALENCINEIKNMAQEEVTSESKEKLQTLSEQLAVLYEDEKQKAADYQKTQSELQQAQTAAQKASEELETANQKYEKEKEEAYQKLEELNSQLEELTSAIEKAQRNKVTEQVTLKKEYDAAVLEGDYAKTVYDTTVEELQKTVEEAEEKLTELKEEKEALLQIEDGVICADRAGVLAAVTYAAGDIIRSGKAYVSYYDTQNITVAVEVSQEEIATLQVGDTVTAMISGKGREMVQGKIASIASEATSGRSVSNVTYTVTIAIDNTQETIDEGQSVVIYFTEELQMKGPEKREEGKR